MSDRDGTRMVFRGQDRAVFFRIRTLDDEAGGDPKRGIRK